MSSYLLKNPQGLWWRAARAGYSNQIGDAGLYEEVYAQTVVRGGRGDTMHRLVDVGTQIDEAYDLARERSEHLRDLLYRAVREGWRWPPDPGETTT